MNWEKVKEISCTDTDGVFRIRTSGKKLVIEKQVDEWKDVTKECATFVCDSVRAIEEGCSSRYFGLEHHGQKVVIFNPLGEVSVRHTDRYKIEIPIGSMFSFKVLMKVS